MLFKIHNCLADMKRLDLRPKYRAKTNELHVPSRGSMMPYSERLGYVENEKCYCAPPYRNGSNMLLSIVSTMFIHT